MLLHLSTHLLLWLSWSIAAASLLALVVFVYVWFFYTDFAKIEGIQEIPHGELLAGHLYQLGDDHATTAEKWSRKIGWPVFQVRMGFRRVIFLNSFDSAREWLIKNQAATADRPWFHTFHGVVSATSGRFSQRIPLYVSTVYVQLFMADTLSTKLQPLAPVRGTIEQKNRDESSDPTQLVLLSESYDLHWTLRPIPY